jgi:hypothetical protein
MSGVLKNIGPDSSRRKFLTTAVGASGATLLRPVWLNAAADEVDPRVTQVMAGTIGIDMHNHVYPRGRNRIRGMVGSGGRRRDRGLPAFSWPKRSNDSTRVLPDA